MYCPHTWTSTSKNNTKWIHRQVFTNRNYCPRPSHTQSILILSWYAPHLTVHAYIMHYTQTASFIKRFYWYVAKSKIGSFKICKCMRIYGNTTNTALQINLLQWFSPFRWLNCEIALSSSYKWQLQTQGPLNLSLTQPHTHTLSNTEQPSHLSEWCKILFAPLRQQKVFGDTRCILTTDCVVSLHQIVQMLPAAPPKLTVYL